MLVRWKQLIVISRLRTRWLELHELSNVFPGRIEWAERSFECLKARQTMYSRFDGAQDSPAEPLYGNFTDVDEYVKRNNFDLRRCAGNITRACAGVGDNVRMRRVPSTQV